MEAHADLVKPDGGVGRLRRALAWLVRPWAAILVPDRRVAAEVSGGRSTLPLFLATACACVAAFAIGARLDLGPEVRASHAGAGPAAAHAPGAAGASEPAAEVKTDREIDDEIAQQTATMRVMLGLDAALATPAKIAFLALALFLLGRFIGGRPSTGRAMTAAALAALPGAVRALVTAAAAWRQPSLGAGDIPTLLSGAALPVSPDHPVLARMLGGVDIFTCWSVLILGFGLAAAADLKRSKAFVAIAIGFVLYLLVTRFIMVGGGPPPGFAGGPPGTGG